MPMRKTRSWSRGTTSLVLLLGAIFAAVSPARGQEIRITDDPAHIDELAGSLQQLSNALCWEMHRFHKEKSDFNEAYRPAKELWSMTGALRDAVRAGPADDRDVVRQLTKMSELFGVVERTCAGWGDGVRPATMPASPSEERTVVVPGTGVDVEIPLLFGGIRVGRSPRTVVSEQTTTAALPPRRAFHPHARGSRRALQRELARVRTALNYLLEDAGLATVDASGSSVPPRPMPPDTGIGPILLPPTKVVPSTTQPPSPATGK